MSRKEDRSEKVEEDLKELKNEITRFKKIRDRFHYKSRADRFGYDDLAQQIIGGLLLTSPFCVTEEVWNIAKAMNPIHSLITVLLTFTIGYMIIYEAKFQKMKENEGEPEFSLRLVSLLFVGYILPTLVLLFLGIIPNFINLTQNVINVIIITSLFSTLGAGTADNFA
ncbi:MAG: putative membrane protein [Candidatus Methanohalarchaeum thermophilum]|uniref:Membrane protein n=1 Tax=Methanohalarchaeum thermophilum TaxID=1903181 RepID=A0A1Q6DX53_METT1|nr:MAG: putative membrane protein [Candidatus Methanohalarchaeum thermophilum]